MDTSRLRNIGTTLWAISDDARARVLGLLINAAMYKTDWEATKPFVQGKGANKIAVIPIQGVLTQDGPGYYGSNYQTIANAVEQAANDPDVKRIILSVDSPGGEVTGLPETAAVIAAAAKVKQVSAMVEGTSASAAYWLASQASDVTVTPSGEVGSVGVRMMHVDMSAMLDKAGYKITELSAGDFKTEWSPYKPLTDEAVAAMQPRIDANHGLFLSAIASGRGTRATAEITAARYGEGRMFDAGDALSHGLVDKVQDSRSFFRALAPSPDEAQTPPSFPIRARLDIEKAR